MDKSSFFGSCPGALACSPAPKVTQEPTYSPATLEIVPSAPIDIVITGTFGFSVWNRFVSSNK